MYGYSEHRKTTNGRLDLEQMQLLNQSSHVCVSARENSKKDRGVDIRIFLGADDVIDILRIIAGENHLLRLRIKAELAALDYQEALQEAEV
jgi:hypothetical protein